MEIAIRPYEESDRQVLVEGYADLQEVEREFTETRRPGADIASAYIDDLIETVESKSGRIFVAHDGNKVAGFVAGLVEREDNVAETEDSTTYGYIADAYVFPEYRGTGLFQRLNTEAEKYLAAFPEVKRIRINVLAANERAVRAYRKAGYTDYEIMLEKKVRHA